MNLRGTSMATNIKKRPYIDWPATGANMAYLMKKKGLTIRDMSNKLSMPPKTISLYIEGRRIPNLKHMVSIAYILKTSIEELIIPVGHLAENTSV